MAREKYPDVIIMVDAVVVHGRHAHRLRRLGTGRLPRRRAEVLRAAARASRSCAVSERAFERAKTIPIRGYYFDFIENEKYAVKFNTPATPGISFLYALDKQMDCMFAEGLENRYARHLEMAKYTPRLGQEALRAVRRRAVPLAHDHAHREQRLRLRRAEQGAGQAWRQISDGYGPFKGKTFRIGHMGDLTLADIQWLTGQIDDILKL